MFLLDIPFYRTRLLCFAGREMLLGTKTQSMDVLIFQPFVRPKQENDLNVVTTRKLTSIGFEPSRDDPIACRRSDAPARFL